MAQVDFSNAVLEPYNINPFEQSNIYLRYSEFYDTNFVDINSNNAVTLVEDTNVKQTYLYTGTFTASGTEFYMMNKGWKISNISFSAGDTYSFAIDIDVSVS